MSISTKGERGVATEICIIMRIMAIIAVLAF